MIYYHIYIYYNTCIYVYIYTWLLRQQPSRLLRHNGCAKTRLKVGVTIGLDLILKKEWPDVRKNHSVLAMCLSGWWLGHPSEKYEFVNWDDEKPNISGNKIQKWQPNHQPVIVIGYFHGIIHSINGVSSVLMNGISGAVTVG